MQQPLPATPPPEPKNKCPDCLCMELEAVPVSSEEFPNNSLPPINLHLTLQFNEQWEQLPGGRIKFGLKGGELRVKLQNGKIPLASRNLAGSLMLSVPKDRQEQGSAEIQSGIEGSQPGNEPAIPITDSEKKAVGITDKFPLTSTQVTIKGSQENPAWVFEVETGESVLKGLLNKAKLGTVEVTTTPCLVEATFEVSKRDVHLIEIEGLLPPNISRNKRAWIEREIALWLLESKFKPYMSRVELQFDTPPSSQQSLPMPEGSGPARGDDETSRPDLQNRIQLILEANTDDFFELAKILDRNPVEDLAGGDLSGIKLNRFSLKRVFQGAIDLSGADLRCTNLSRNDLSGVNLSLANLRRASLTRANLNSVDLSRADLSKASLRYAELKDANLSEAKLIENRLSNANLSNANLHGADLSNANLRDANLSNADLSNANLSGTSLKDANLSGANLVNANLSDANLTDANLSDADVKNAQFVGSLGISEETKAILSEQGAIFTSLPDKSQVGSELPPAENSIAQEPLDFDLPSVENSPAQAPLDFDLPPVENSPDDSLGDRS